MASDIAPTKHEKITILESQKEIWIVGSIDKAFAVTPDEADSIGIEFLGQTALSCACHRRDQSKPGEQQHSVNLFFRESIRFANFWNLACIHRRAAAPVVVEPPVKAIVLF